MSMMWEGESEDESQTQETTQWQDKLVKDFTCDQETSYRGWFYAEINGTLTNRGIAARVLLQLEGQGNEELGVINWIPQDATYWFPFSTVKLKTIPVGNHTVRIQFISGHSSQTAKIRRARISVDKK